MHLIRLFKNGRAPFYSNQNNVHLMLLSLVIPISDNSTTTNRFQFKRKKKINFDFRDSLNSITTHRIESDT